MKRKRRTHLRFKTSAYHNKDTIINYLKLYNSLIENEITDDDFDKEINDNPENYFVYINGKDNDPEYGLMITFHWLLWQLSFWIDKEVIV